MQQETGILSTIMQESLNGHRVVHAFAREQFEDGRFDAKNQAVRNLQLAALRLSAWNSPLMIMALNVVTVLMLWVGGAAVIGHALSLGVLVAVVTLRHAAQHPRALLRLHDHLADARGSPAAQRIFEVLDTESVIKDKPTRPRSTASTATCASRTSASPTAANGALNIAGSGAGSYAGLSGKREYGGYGGYGGKRPAYRSNGKYRSNGSNGKQ